MCTKTRHCVEQARTRLNLKNDSVAERNIDLAYARGKRACDFRSNKEKVFLMNKARSNSCAIAYNGFCYIMSSEGVCITLYRLPAWFGKRQRYKGKERIRDYKSFVRNHADFLLDNDIE